MSKHSHDLSDDSFKKSIFASVIILWILTAVICVMRTKDEMEAHNKAAVLQFKQLDITPEQIIDVEKIGKEKKLTVKLQKRTLQYGLEGVAPFIVTSNEWMKMGKTIIPVEEIINRQIQDSTAGNNSKKRTHEASPHHAVFIVKEGANIWEVHHNFFEKVLLSNGIKVVPIADDPDRSGFSSGKGKLVNFSEKMSYVHPIQSTRKKDPSLRLVVYPLTRLFALIDQLKDSKISHLEFDGHSMWLPDHSITLAGLF